MELWWSNKYTFGSQLDDERRAIFKLAKRFLTRQDLGSARDVVIDLVRYGKESFVKEERLMESAHYADADLHKQRHQFLANHATRLLLSDVLAKDAKPGSNFVIKVATTLEMWILDHFMAEDPVAYATVAKAIADR